MRKEAGANKSLKILCLWEAIPSYRASGKDPKIDGLACFTCARSELQF